MVRPRRAPTGAVSRRTIATDDAAAVFARAAELDVERLLPTVDDDDGLDEDELLEAASAAGLSPVAVRQALAEWRSGAIGSGADGSLVVASGTGATWVGPRAVVVQRVVDLPVGRARSAAQRFLREQLYEVERDRAGRSTWRPRKGWIASAQRTFDVLSRRLDLDGVVDPIALAVVEEPGSDGQRSLVRFEADLAPVRNGMAWGVGGTAATVGVVGGAVAGILIDPIGTVLGLPAAGAATGVGVAASRATYRRRREQAETCFEGFLDKLERRRG